jgi:sugar phosphate isomerase/epimerase
MNERHISISTCFNYEIPIQEQIPLIAEAGFTHVSLGESRKHFNYSSPDQRRSLLTLLDEFSLQVDTIHGPQADKATAQDLALTAEAAVDLHASVVVMHGGPFEFADIELEPRLVQLKKTCLEMHNIGTRTGITFALENVLPGPATELVVRAIRELPSNRVGFCYDSSHDQIGGPRSFDLLEGLIDRLVAVHLSDRVREFVDHVIPGEGFIPWNDVCRILRTCPRQFPLLLEVMTANSKEKDTIRFLHEAFQNGARLYKLIYS